MQEKCLLAFNIIQIINASKVVLFMRMLDESCGWRIRSFYLKSNSYSFDLQFATHSYKKKIVGRNVVLQIYENIDIEVQNKENLFKIDFAEQEETEV